MSRGWGLLLLGFVFLGLTMWLASINQREWGWVTLLAAFASLAYGQRQMDRS